METANEIRLRPDTANSPRHHEVELLAFAFWRERGGPIGTPEVDWFRAEEELNEGHRHIALSAYITVTAGSARELEIACGDVEQQAGQARLDIRREFGTQDVAFTYTLPLCRGLR